MQNRAGKKQKYICKCRAVKCLAAVIQRGMAAALVFVLCFFMAFTMPIQAASGDAEHHEDTLDYCLRVHNVTVYMSELQGLEAGQKKALVENASGYAFYTWRIPYRAWEERVSGSGDFSGVNWDQEGSYKITVRMPALSDGVVSEVSYTLTIVDDLPEPEPPAPVTYRVTVRFLDEETGEPLKEDFVSDEMEEAGDKKLLKQLYEELLKKDWFMTFPDFESYCKAKEEALAAYEDRMGWAKKMAVNIANAGYFSSDRTIEQYNKDIWHLEKDC